MAVQRLSVEVQGVRVKPSEFQVVWVKPSEVQGVWVVAMYGRVVRDEYMGASAYEYA